MLKSLSSFFSIFLALTFLCACSEDFYPTNIEESFEFYPVKMSTDDMSEFFSDIKNYASTIEEGLTLGTVQLFLDQNFDYKVKCEFSKFESYKSVFINLIYNPQNEGIEYTQYLTGPTKVYSPFVEDFDYSHWKMNFDEALQELKEEMKIKGIQTFDKIICNCYAKTWTFRIYPLQKSTDSDIILITIYP